MVCKRKNCRTRPPCDDTGRCGIFNEEFDDKCPWSSVVEKIWWHNLLFQFQNIWMSLPETTSNLRSCSWKRMRKCLLLYKPSLVTRDRNCVNILTIVGFSLLPFQLDAEKAKLKLERWASRDAGSGGGRSEEMESSGDCDDEDGCQGSGDRIHTAGKCSFYRHKQSLEIHKCHN